MKKAFIIIFIIFIALSCTGPKLIPEDKMQTIITESLISEAVARNLVQNASAEGRKKYDSIDFYAPVLEKYGYNLADFTYSAAEMAMRKSNPLDNIFTNVVADMDRRNDMATYFFNRMKKYDTLAMNFYADTIFKKDTMVKGNFAKLKIPTFHNVKEGKYLVMFDYLISQDYKIGSKMLKYKTNKRSKKNNRPIVSSQIWLNRYPYKDVFKGEIVLEDGYETLNIEFDESAPTGKEHVIDSSIIENIRIILYPEINKARLDYMNHILGFDKIFPKINIDEYTKDSIPVPFVRKRETGEKRSR